MKATIISFILLAVIIVFLIINGILLVNFSKSLEEQISKLSDEPSEALEDVRVLYERWNKWEPFVSVSVVHLESETVTDAATLMLEYAEAGDKTEYNAAKAKFKNAIKHIGFSGTVSLKTIL